MKRLLFIVVAFLLMSAGAIYSVQMSGSAKALGSGSDQVARCTVVKYSIPDTDTVTQVTARVKCTRSGDYKVFAWFSNYGTTKNGSTLVTLTANTPQDVTIALNGSVDISSGNRYRVDFRILKR